MEYGREEGGRGGDGGGGTRELVRDEVWGMW